MAQKENKKDITVKHPETKKGEVFIGYMSLDFFRKSCGWNTKRSGWPVDGGFPDSDGEDVSVPVFVQRTEIEEQIKKNIIVGLNTDGLDKLLD